MHDFCQNVPGSLAGYNLEEMVNIPRKLCTVATKYLPGDSAADENKPKNDKITIKY